MSKLVKHVCSECKNACKIVDYEWDNRRKFYNNEIKNIGYLCEGEKFSKKKYRKQNNFLGECSDFIKVNKIREIHNNKIYKGK